MKKLYKIRSEAVVGGVCAGIAEYFNIDKTVVRVAFCSYQFNEWCILRCSFLYCLYDGYA